MSDGCELSAEQSRDFDALLSELIPPGDGGRLPGAGELGLAPAILAAGCGAPAFEPALRSGLGRLAAISAEQGDATFAELAPQRRLAVVELVNEAQPGFIQSLLAPTYTAYYSTPQVVRALGMETWPPYPEGFPLETGDLSLLDPVRERGARFREA